MVTMLNDPHIRRVDCAGRTWYAVTDLMEALSDTRHPSEDWEALSKREPAVAAMAERHEFHYSTHSEMLATLTAEGVLRLVQSLSTPQAERLKKWLAESALQRLEESENPEQVLARMRKAYEERGYTAKWIDKRLRGVSARQEVTGEWRRRGVEEGEQYRALTNAIMEGVFGMDVERLRRYKNLQRTTQNLRDYMSDLELVLTSLAETAAVSLHRDRASQGFEELFDDATEAGRIAGAARVQIEQGGARKPRRMDEHAEVNRRY
jgi:DNA-damage-inducible protein D